MQEYVRSGIAILNDVTEDLKDLNGLGRYLSKQPNADAIKVLKLMILGHETGLIEKDFDINSVGLHTYLVERTTGTEYKQRENIIGNLSMNPQNIALELMDYLSKNYSTDYGFKCYGMYSIIDNWLRSFERMDYCDTDMFYKRYDMVDKKMDIIEFLISNGLLSKKQIDSVLASYQLLLKEDVGLNKAQLLRIQKVVDNIIRYNELYSKISHSKNIPRQEKSKLYNELESTFGIARKPKEGLFDDCKHNALEEIRRYRMENDQCTYMLYDVQKLIKEKKI